MPNTFNADGTPDKDSPGYDYLSIRENQNRELTSRYGLRDAENSISNKRFGGHANENMPVDVAADNVGLNRKEQEHEMYQERIKRSTRP